MYLLTMFSSSLVMRRGHPRSQQWAEWEVAGAQLLHRRATASVQGRAQLVLLRAVGEDIHEGPTGPTGRRNADPSG